jgi:hypothetical protein
MKLRLKGNSLRLRLTPGEVDHFGAIGIVTETVKFGDSQLIYSLETSGEARAINASFADNHIVVIVPVSTAKNWVESEQVSLTGEHSFEKDSPNDNLKITIEKDFVYFDKSADSENSDTFTRSAEKHVIQEISNEET